MSDKKRAMLSPLDQQLRTQLPVGMFDGIQIRIDKICGFEKFNTRAYHNYETWADGYSIIGPLDGAWTPYRDFLAAAEEAGVDETAAAKLWRLATGQMSRLLRVEREDLDDAIDEWFERRDKVREILAEDPPQPNQRTRLAVLGYHYDPDA